ncbi:MAG: branched-chain amino acid ABC transporter, permease protein LivM [Ktedonobacterales bacterium]|nr:MAG: branched-chain amino acid ABC transporter, permease protein LivM [Ktedonobacterales bacterium]
MTASTPSAAKAGGANQPGPSQGGVIQYVQRHWVAVVVLALVIAFPFLDFTSDAVTHVTVLVNAGVFVLMALGLNIVVGYAGLLDLGYVAFFTLGAYSYAMANFGNIIRTKSGIAYQVPGQTIPGTPITLSVWPMLLGGLVVAAVFGILLGAPTLRLRGDYLAIVTLGFGEIVPIIFHNNAALGGAFGFTGLDLPSSIPTPLGPIKFSFLNQVTFYYFILILCLLAVLLVLSIRNSRFGRAWIAIREDETAAAASGVNLVRTKLLAFAMGASLGGLAGVFYASHLTTVTYDQFDFSISIYVLVMVVLGGMGSIPGVIAGAVVVYFVNSYVLGYLNNTLHDHNILVNFDFSQIRNLLYGLVLILMMILRPEGLIPSARRRQELHTFEQRTDEGAVEALDAPPGLGVVGNPDGQLEE